MDGSLATHLRRSAFEKAVFSDVSITFAYGALPFSMTYDLHKVILMQSPFFNDLLLEQGSQKERRLQFTIDLQRALAYKGFLPTLLAGPPNPERRLAYRILGSHIAFNLCWLYETDKQALLDTLQPDDIIRVLIISILFDINDLTQQCLRLYMSKRLAVNTIVSDLHLIGQLPHSSTYYHELRDAALLILFRNGAENAESLCELPLDWMQDILSAELLFVQGEFERYMVLKRVLQTLIDEVENTMRMNDSEAIERNKQRLSSFASSDSIDVDQPGADITAEEIMSRKRKRQNDEGPHAETRFLVTRPSRYKFDYSSKSSSLKGYGHLPAGSPYSDKINALRSLLNDSIIYSNMTFSQLSLVRADGLVEEGTVFRALWQREALERLIFPTVDLKADKSHDDGSTELIPDRHDALSEYFDVGTNSGLNQTSIAKKKRMLLGTPKFRFGTSIQLTSMRNSEWKEDMVFLGQNDEEEADAIERMLSDPNGDLASCQGYSSDDENDQENEPLLGEHWQGRDPGSMAASKLSSKRVLAQLVSETSNDYPSKYVKALRNTFYSAPKTILGTRYRVRVEAFVLSFENLPKKLVCNFELQRSKGKIDFRRYQIRRTARESLEALAISQNDSSSTLSTVRSRSSFATFSPQPMSKRQAARQPTPSRIPYPQSSPTKYHQDQAKQEKIKSSRRRASSTPPKPSIALLKELEGAGGKCTSQMKDRKVTYSLYCLNRHMVAGAEGIVSAPVEREHRAFMPVSKCEMSEESDDQWMATERVPGKSYTTNVILTDGIVETSNIDVMVVMELFDLSLA
ncbi:hypothetical protein BC943DRAFT_319769 [Umbelopsis sp. AD052]|nr:hypothetical protein BC943DRAFT_319769 [Umbelopsis sp. AD052]